MKRIQSVPKLSDIKFIVERVAGDALSLGVNVLNVVRGFSRVIEVKSGNSQGIQIKFSLPIRKVDTGMLTDVECYGATPQIGVGGAGYGFATLSNTILENKNFFGIANGGVNSSNPYATPTSFSGGGGAGGGFGGIFKVPLSNPTATLDSNVLLISAGSGGAGGPGFGTAAASGGTGGSGRPSFDPRSVSNAAGGGPGATTKRYTAASGSDPTDGENNNTPGGGSGGAGYYGGSAGAQGTDGGQGTRANNGGGGGAGYISPLLFKGESVGGLGTSPGGRSSKNYSFLSGLSEPTDGIKSKIIINQNY